MGICNPLAESRVPSAKFCFEHVSAAAEERIISANHLVNHGLTAEVFVFEFLVGMKSVGIALETVFYLCLLILK